MKRRYFIGILCLILVIASLFATACSEKEKDTEECDHRFRDWETIAEPTCTEKGEKTRECRVCELVETEEINAVGHKEKTIAAVKATCEKEGSTEGKRCTVCDVITVEPESTGLGDHDYTISFRIDPECGKKGKKTFQCRHCHEFKSEQTEIPEVPLEEIAASAQYSVAKITAYDSQNKQIAAGACFAYHTKGWFVTEYKLIKGASSAKITIGGKTFPVEFVLMGSEEYDLAVVQIRPEGNTIITLLEVCFNDHPAGGAAYVLSADGTVAEGNVIKSKVDVGTNVCVQHDAAVSDENYGSPLINQYGEVIGINIPTDASTETVYHSVAVLQLRDLDALNITFEEFYNSTREIS